jgi:chemotaxis protein methyltransferase CheR
MNMATTTDAAEITVEPDEMKISTTRGEILVANEIRSAIAVAIHDPVAGVGGLLHVSRPLSAADKDDAAEHPLRYVDIAVPKLFREAYAAGAKKERLVVTVAGGGVAAKGDAAGRGVATKNLVVLKRLLWRNQLLIEREDTGGYQVRAMHLEVGSGRAWSTCTRPGIAGSVASTMTYEQFEEVSELVKSSCGINLHSGKRELVRTRLTKRIRELGLKTFEEYLERVRTDTSCSEVTSLLDVVSTNHTSFFREPRHFEYLRDSVLPKECPEDPELRRLRIWSAGCSSGEEPYSIAMVLSEHLPQSESWDAKILATDLSTRALARAKDGVFAPERVETVSKHLLTKYFEKKGRHDEARFAARPALKDMITFARLNLIGEWPLKGPFDVIFCRNVMIYFDKPTQAKLVERFHSLLAPRGILFIGHSESLMTVKHKLRYVQPTVYEKI